MPGAPGPGPGPRAPGVVDSDEEEELVDDIIGDDLYAFIANLGAANRSSSGERESKRIRLEEPSSSSANASGAGQADLSR